MKYRFYLFTIISVLFLMSNSFSNTCIDGAQLISAEFSLNDSSFASDFDGSTGVFQRIYLNQSILGNNNYSLWQSPLIDKKYDKGDLVIVRSGEFDYDPHFNSNKNSMPSLNMSGMTRFSIFTRITLKNQGNCDYVGFSEIRNSANVLTHYGVNHSSATLRHNYKSGDWTFTGVPIAGEATQIFESRYRGLIFNGRLDLQIGPVAASGVTPDPYQHLISRVWLDKRPSVCGDGLFGFTPSGQKERCEPGVGFSHCTNDCRTPISVCGNGDEEHYWQYYPNGDHCWGCFSSFYNNLTQSASSPTERCDPGLNNANSYNCSLDCSQRFAQCGNGITEQTYQVLRHAFRYGSLNKNRGAVTLSYTNSEECDYMDPEYLGTGRCDTSCRFTSFCGNGVCELNETVQPNQSGYCPVDCYQTPTFNRIGSDTWRGHNLTPGENLTITFDVTNPNPTPLVVAFQTKFYYTYYSQRQNNLNYRFIDIGENLRTNGFADYRSGVGYGTPFNFNPAYFEIPGNSTGTIVKQVPVVNVSDLKRKSMGHSRIVRQIYYNFNVTNHTGWHIKPGDWGRAGTPDSSGGAFYPSLCVKNLRINNTHKPVIINSEGIPSLRYVYEHGQVRANDYGIPIPPNSIFFEGKLQLHESGDEMDVEPYYINRTIIRNYRWDKRIRPFHMNDAPELGVYVNYTIPIYNYTRFNNERVSLDITPYNTFTDTECIYPGTLESAQVPIQFYNVFMSSDTPLKFYPNGGGGYSTLYGRSVIFNYNPFSLYDAQIDFKVRKLNAQGDYSHYFDIEHFSSFSLPADASFPIPFKVTYVGPAVSSQETYFLDSTVSYYDPIEDDVIEKHADSILELYPDTIDSSDLFSDLIPVEMNFTLLNLDSNASLKVKVANQGTQDVNSNVDVSLYVKPVSETGEFTHVETLTISGIDSDDYTRVNFSFTPLLAEKFIIKIVVDENNTIFEDDFLTGKAEENNILTSIALVRDLDVELVFVRPDYTQAKDGIIPFNVFVRNKGIGGIDDYRIKLDVFWKSVRHTFYSPSFYSIPPQGRNETFYWNVSNIEAHPYEFTAELETIYDKNLNDNIKRGVVNFCPLPWKNNAIFECNIQCSSDCYDTLTDRYNSICNGINQCKFHSPEFASACDGYLVGSYAAFNSSHDASCPDASIRNRKRFSYRDINITSRCDNLIIVREPAILRGQFLNMIIASCAETNYYG